MTMKQYNESFSEFQPFPHHLEKLIGEHGLNLETIEEAGLFSATAQTLNLILNRTDVACDGIVIPYNINGFNRVRLDIPIVLNGNEAKYLSPTGSKNHLYIPKAVQSILKDASKRLYFTEGEFKSLKATQEGFPCIGLGGVWGFQSEGALLEDFEEIELKNREVLIVLDNDARFNFNVAYAGYALAIEITKLGAKIRVVILPEIPEVSNV